MAGHFLWHPTSAIGTTIPPNTEIWSMSGAICKIIDIFWCLEDAGTRQNKINFFFWICKLATSQVTWNVFLTITQGKDLVFSITKPTIGGPSSSCDIIILRNNSYGGIIRVFVWAYLRPPSGINKIRQILKKNTSPYFHSVSFVIWPLTLMKRAHLSEFFISRFSTYIRKAQGWTFHFRTPDPRSEKSKLKMTGRPQIQRRIQANIL